MKFEPGFRLSIADTIILIAGGVAAIYLATVEVLASFIVAFVIGHFFLFCNVFRISRPPELIWAATFVGLSIMTITVGFPGWILTAVISLMISIGSIIRETKSPSYHGIFWKKFNPGLEERWHKGLGIK